MTRTSYQTPDPTPGVAHPKPERVRVSPGKVGTKRQKHAKPVRVRSVEYMGWIRGLACRVCCRGFGKAGRHGENVQHSPTEVAHVSLGRGEKGMRSKVSDLMTLPLCGGPTGHHRGPAGLDTIGREAFERRYSLSLADEMLALICEYVAEGRAL